jgi:hypothetical protein
VASNQPGNQVPSACSSQNNFQINGSKPVAAVQNQLMDMIQVPFWDGNPGVFPDDEAVWPSLEQVFGVGPTYWAESNLVSGR